MRSPRLWPQFAGTIKGPPSAHSTPEESTGPGGIPACGRQPRPPAACLPACELWPLQARFRPCWFGDDRRLSSGEVPVIGTIRLSLASLFCIYTQK